MTVAKPSTLPHPAYKGLRSTLISILVSMGLVIIKGTAGILGNSYALIADAIESASDVFSSLILFAGLRIAAKAPDKDHPYGHGKAEPLAATIIALTMTAAAILIVVESISNILTPHEVPKTFTLWVLGAVILVKEVLFRFIIKIGEEADSTAVKADAWHHRSDAITSGAAFIGISIALIGGKGYEVADDYAALIAAVIIFLNAYRVFRPALNEVMDAAPSADIIQEVKVLASDVPGVKGLEKCFVRKMGFELFVDLHVLVDGDLSVREGHDIAHAVKAVILDANPRIYDVLIHVEPLDATHEPYF
ncbi:cation transporter [Adhaeribacter aerolatus]|uniref:Cation transporter n=1 Tax=Adhaeribacter aerolatus TaxID=670289 RepID=A0A512B3Z3_9BACT|nr:cation diffusion facilitator family transporter [Adhaeribacter aerolatus]GEO06507.1 cation transporter [Adhaeribacter aerolatus]